MAKRRVRLSSGPGPAAQLQRLFGSIRTAFRAGDCDRAQAIAKQIILATPVGNDRAWRSAMKVAAAAAKCRR